MIVMYKKIGVVGDKDSVLAFKALGVDVAPVVGADEARRAVDKMAMNDYAVIFRRNKNKEALKLATYIRSLI